jgi:hypothetical protein
MPCSELARTLRYKISFPKPNAPKKEEKETGDPIVH